MLTHIVSFQPTICATNVMTVLLLPSRLSWFCTCRHAYKLQQKVAAMQIALAEAAAPPKQNQQYTDVQKVRRRALCADAFHLGPRLKVRRLT